MQLQHLALFAFAAIAAAAAAKDDKLTDDRLKDIINDFPDCSLPCFSQSADAKGCEVTDFDCVCKMSLDISAKMGSCTDDYCGAIDKFNSGKLLGDLCNRWDKNPSSSEEAEATSALASGVSAASATVTARPKSDAQRGEAGMLMAGAAAAAAFML